MVWYPCAYKEKIEGIADLAFTCLRGSKSKMIWHLCIVSEQIEVWRNPRVSAFLLAPQTEGSRSQASRPFDFYRSSYPPSRPRFQALSHAEINVTGGPSSSLRHRQVPLEYLQDKTKETSRHETEKETK
ncbi:hypothetical protein PVK06_047101 [Gossypium arboreum]|uniref:Uncharacterized protein n=1 Tax=Gossypium arboreum TaxID=29729 RepID=A0ABR0MCE5_GOSAR|nr:hypothetical protein PVK06_047101 [Gossypium arboreum]